MAGKMESGEAYAVTYVATITGDSELGRDREVWALGEPPATFWG